MNRFPAIKFTLFFTIGVLIGNLELADLFTSVIAACIILITLLLTGKIKSEIINSIKPIALLILILVGGIITSNLFANEKLLCYLKNQELKMLRFMGLFMI